MPFVGELSGDETINPYIDHQEWVQEQLTELAHWLK